MNDYTKYLASRVTAGGLSRREFLGRAMAAGLTLAVADKNFTVCAEAAEPKRGGHLKLGLEGGGQLDPGQHAQVVAVRLQGPVGRAGRVGNEHHEELDPGPGGGARPLALFSRPAGGSSHVRGRARSPK